MPTRQFFQCRRLQIHFHSSHRSRSNRYTNHRNTRTIRSSKMRPYTPSFENMKSPRVMTNGHIPRMTASHSGGHTWYSLPRRYFLILVDSYLLSFLHMRTNRANRARDSRMLSRSLRQHRGMNHPSRSIRRAPRRANRRTKSRTTTRTMGRRRQHSRHRKGAQTSVREGRKRRNHRNNSSNSFSPSIRVF